MSKKKKKRVLLVTQYFYPESFKSNDIAFELVKRGYEVDALVSIPNYPEGRYYKGYGLFQKRIERINGVKVYRAFQTPRGRKATGLGLSLNYLTYAFFASIWALFFSLFKRKYHSIIVFQTSPITQALPAVVLAKLRKVPMYLWVQDVWPSVAYYNLKSSRAKKFIAKVSNSIYNNSYKILISSKGFKSLIDEYIGSNDKIIYFPNWSEDIKMMPKIKIPDLPPGYKITMAGNLGQTQRLEDVMRLVLKLRDLKELKWIFIGDGSRKKWLEEYVKKNNLEETVFILGRYPFEYMPSFYDDSDAMLLSLLTNKIHLHATIPSRIQSYMSSGKPILAIAGRGVKDLIEEADCGLAIDDDNLEIMESYIREIISNKKDSFATKGKHGREYYLSNFTIDICIDDLESILINK